MAQELPGEQIVFHDQGFAAHDFLPHGPPFELPPHRLSVVVPMYCESQNVGVALEAISHYAGEATDAYEIVAVDDGSRDDT